MLDEIVVGVLTEEVEVSPAGVMLGFTNGIRTCVLYVRAEWCLPSVACLGKQHGLLSDWLWRVWIAKVW